MATLSEATIRQLADPQSFDRGRQYFTRGAVVRLSRRGDQVQAEVEGSSYLPYQVAITPTAAGIGQATCTCPYEWGGACKHIVAVLLAALHEPERIEERSPLDQTLAALDRDQLQALVLGLAERHPGLADTIEAQALAVTSRPPAAVEPTGARSRQTAIDPKPFRRQVQSALHSLDRMRSSEAYWHVGGVVGDVLAVAGQARPFIDAGDGRNALVILEAVTQEYVDSWFDLDGSDGETAEAFPELGALLTEAILSADLTAAERDVWAQRLAGWDREVSEYGVEDAFGAARAAAIQGWDDPRLVRILRGDARPEDMRSRTSHAGYDFDDEDEGEQYYEDDDEDEDEDDLPYDARWYADQLTTARLNVLERQGRQDEYLNLAAAEGRQSEYVTMLVRLGRTAEAVQHGRTSLTGADDALALARALHEHGATEDALRIAEHGLSLAGEHLTLARWLRDQATAAGDAERALSAALIAVRRSVDLDDYRAVQTLAGDGWPAHRDDLLKALRGRITANPHLGVQILLHENLIDEAIALADEAPYQYTVVEQVADAAVESRPEWVIRTCRAQAERIMDDGKSKYYHYAADWLKRGRAAAIAAGHETEWRAYMDGVIAQHKRKYSLVPLLEPLR